MWLHLSAIDNPPWYIDFFRDKAALTVFFIVLLVFTWKWVLPNIDAERKRKQLREDENHQRLIDSLRQSEEKRAEGEKKLEDAREELRKSKTPPKDEP